MPTRRRACPARATLLALLAAGLLAAAPVAVRAAQNDDVVAKARALVDAKRYGEADSSSFVNGILDALKRRYRDQTASA